MSAADTIAAHGIQNAQALVQAAAAVGLPTYVGVAFVEHESGGANVFGHDGGGAYSGGGTVTQAKYNDFLRLVRGGHTSNGVGPCQLTYPGYFKPVTTEVANLWKPYENMVYGFKLIKASLGGNYTDANLNRAGQIYNSGRANGAPAYGSLTVTLCHKWKALLGSGTVPSTGGGSTDYTTDLAHWFTKAQMQQWQKLIGVSADGIVGIKTLEASQKFLGVHVDGVIGSATVKALQKWAGMSAADQDGKLGPKTAAAVVKKLSGASTPAPTTKPLPVLKKGSTGTQVKTVQAFLLKEFPAYAGPIKSSGGADGKYGDGTVAVVKGFQKRSKIASDGVIGPNTWAALKKNGLKI